MGWLGGSFRVVLELCGVLHDTGAPANRLNNIQWIDQEHLDDGNGNGHGNDKGRCGAFFDVDGCLLTATASLQACFFLAWHTALSRFLILIIMLPPLLPLLAVVDKFDRGRANRVVHLLCFAGVPRAHVARTMRLWLENRLQRHTHAHVVRRLQWHLAQQHRVFLISGSPLLTVGPLGRYWGVCAVGGTISEVMGGKGGKANDTNTDASAGTLTGRVPRNGMVVGGVKAELLQLLAQQSCVDPSISYAYGDHHSDIDILRCVGNPVATNPNAKLRRHALAHGWSILE